MDLSECSDFPAKENNARVDEELNKTECENIKQKNQSNKVYKCEYCHFKSKYKQSVTIHEKSIHLMQKFPCDHCGYKATQQSHLTIHKQSKHEGINYSCSKCD